MNRFDRRIQFERASINFGENEDRRLLVRPYAGAHRKEFDSDTNPFRPSAPGVYAHVSLGDSSLTFPKPSFAA